MQEHPSELINVSELRTGMFVELELGWMTHPFPTGSFKITSDRQIETIRALGLTQVRYVPSKSDSAADPADAVPSNAQGTGRTRVPRALVTAEESPRQLQRSKLLDAQRGSMVVCERRFGEAVRQYKQVISLVETQPHSAREQCLGMISNYVGEMSNYGESAIRLLSQGSSERVSLHPVNVTVLSLLLGKAMGLSEQALLDLGMAAFLHDVGKQLLPERVRSFNPSFTTPEYKLYQEHVTQGIEMAKRMGLSEGALQAIAAHHEMVDGSGFPSHAKGNELAMPGKILALVNRYENLCNPSRPASALTPHEALSLIFAQLKTRFDSMVMSAFIRMMGVFPPGSIIQLLDDRYAMVVSVNSSRPLKPRVIVHDPKVPMHEALILDLENAPELGIRRSLKPTALPAESVDYLLPRQRVCYFFEQATDSAESKRRATAQA
jgi:putative nucleotidyltransferase with HDIG domain